MLLQTIFQFFHGIFACALLVFYSDTPDSTDRVYHASIASLVISSLFPELILLVDFFSCSLLFEPFHVNVAPITGTFHIIFNIP